MARASVSDMADRLAPVSDGLPATPRRDDPSQAASHRRSLDGLPGVLRAPGGQVRHVCRRAHERGVRVLLDDREPPAGRGADARRGGVRRGPDHLPDRGVRGVQGQPRRDAGAVPRPGRGDPAGAGHHAHPVPVQAAVRGRRHPGDPVGAGARAGHAGAHLHGRPRRAPAGQRGRHGPVPGQGRLGARTHDARRGRGEVRRPARAVPRSGGAGGGVERQPAGHPRGRPEDRRQVDRAVRRPAGDPRVGGGRSRQGGRVAARQRRAGRAEPSAQPAPHGRRAAAGARGPGRPSVGPARAARDPRGAGVPGHPGPALRDASRRGRGLGDGGRGRRAEPHRARRRASSVRGSPQRAGQPLGLDVRGSGRAGAWGRVGRGPGGRGR